jgi:hypothetical protein
VQIILEDLEDFVGQRQDPFLGSLAEDAQLGIGQLQIFELEGQDFAGTQAVEQHQACQGEIAKGAKAAPKFDDFFSREGHDHTPGLP